MISSQPESESGSREGRGTFDTVGVPYVRALLIIQKCADTPCCHDLHVQPVKE